MDNTKDIPTVLSICTGYEGIGLGLERVFGKINTLANVEIEGFAIANLVNKMETGRLVSVPIWTNLKTFRPRIFRNKVDILIGGYPCQPFSTAGKRKGEKDPRHLWPWIRSAIKVIQPKFCFFENVEGHISLGLKEVLADLVDIGYRVDSDSGEPTWGLFSAAEVGAPHQRKRMFILAYPKSQRNDREAWCGSKTVGGSRGALPREPEWSSGRQKELAHGNGVRLEGRQGIVQEQETGEDEWDAAICGERCECDVAHAKSREPRQSETRNRREGSQRGSEKLENTKHNGPYILCEDTRAVESQQQRMCKDRQFERASASRWPSRPGQYQYKWEEPRVLVDTKKPGLPWSGEPYPDSRGECEEDRREVFSGITNTGSYGGLSQREESNSQTEPQLGRAVDGTHDRVDRLRLLGNGVVPATAEKAFRTLYGRIINPNMNYVEPSIQLEMF